MSANVETMFSVRETPWHGLGRIVMDAPASREALELAGLDWQVESPAGYPRLYSRSSGHLLAAGRQLILELRRLSAGHGYKRVQCRRASLHLLLW